MADEPVSGISADQQRMLAELDAADALERGGQMETFGTPPPGTKDEPKPPETETPTPAPAEPPAAEEATPGEAAGEDAGDKAGKPEETQEPPLGEDKGKAAKAAPPAWWNERLGEETGKRRGAERERDQARAEVEELRRQLTEAGKPPEPAKVADAQPPEAAKPQPKPKPKFEDFEGEGENAWDRYVEAAAEWHAEQKADQKVAPLLEKLGAVEAKLAAREEADRRRPVLEAMGQSYREAAAELPDLEQVCQSAEDAEVPEWMQLAIEGSPKSAQLIYHLLKHPEERQAILSLPPGSALMKLGEIQAQYAKPKPPEKAPEPPKPPKPASKAPAPIVPVGGRAASSSPPGSGLADVDRFMTEQEGRYGGDW